ncbi:fatty acid desaturase family protein [Actinomadura sp. 6N118]|uniref:fatty acid desaturase family protein n=1 Tax=Actinomadura sp. 6N118 TaxID=3375151 RepID=UPI003789AFCE
MTTDSVVKARIRAELPARTFARRPLRGLFIIPMLTANVGISVLVLFIPMPWYIALGAAAVIGGIYGSMMFLAHEVGHGAVVRSRHLQLIIMYPGCAAFLLSPHLWTIWHNQSHHGHTNKGDDDPDSFGSIEQFRVSSKWSQEFLKFAPGSKYLRSSIYLFAFFTLQAQAVLWCKSKVLPGYQNLNRKKAISESAIMAAAWGAAAILMGPSGALFVIVVPMLVANFVVLSYVVTNHMIRPLSTGADILSTTMSVTTHPILDRIHFHFSHHVEHHLFPAMPSSMAPRVRSVLRVHFADAYLAPSHLRALLAIFHSPRIYAEPRVLIDPYRGSRADITRLETDLREAENHVATADCS